MWVWVFGRRHGTVRAYGGGHGATYLFGYLCSLSFPFVCRGVACNILPLVLARGRSGWWCVAPYLPISYLVLLAAAPAHLLLPCAPYASECAGLGMLSLLLPLVGHTPLLVGGAVIVVLFVAWRSGM